ncbi:MAG: 4,5-DOPA dioxygenase extradiol [Myxococcota bacterium]|jgi:4,5-DOPA dioxygenase extradiol
MAARVTVPQIGGSSSRVSSGERATLGVGVGMEPTRRELLAGLSAGALVGCAGDQATLGRPTAPSLYIGHGSPMLAVDPARGAAMRAMGEDLGEARAILAFSAHWLGTPLTLGAVEAFPLNYDFTGFPQELYEVRYPYRGAPGLAQEVAALATTQVGEVYYDELRNFDHGVWTPLVHMVPDGDVPILQVSLPTGLGPEGLFALGRALAPLRRSGVVFFCSGNLTHGITGDSASGAQAHEFDAWAVEAIGAGDFDALIDAPNKAPAFVLNHPSDEHWLPILVAAGASSAWSEEASYPVEGFEGENISQRCVRWG